MKNWAGVASLALFLSLTLPVLGRSDGSFPGKGSYTAWINANKLLEFGNENAAHGDFDKACTYYKQAINTYEYDSIYYFNLGNAFSQKAQYPIAEESYRKATELEPDYFQAWVNLGHALARQGRFAEASKVMKQALKLAKTPEEKAAIEKNISQFDSMPALESPPDPNKKAHKKKKRKPQAEIPDSSPLPH